jgi:mRNA interferase RelE/StbE
LKYKILTTQKFDKAFSKLDKYTQKIIKSWIVKNLVDTENPRIHGKGLVANKSGQWRYRIGDYRLLCDIQDDQLVILMIDIGHRRNIYNKG